MNKEPLSMFHSAEAFEAHATIAAGYWILERMRQHNAPKTALDVAIDYTTGYAAYRDTVLAKNAMDVMEDIIEAKEVIGADAEPDRRFLEALKQFTTQND